MKAYAEAAPARGCLDFTKDSAKEQPGRSPPAQKNPGGIPPDASRIFQLRAEDSGLPFPGGPAGLAAALGGIGIFTVLRGAFPTVTLAGIGVLAVLRGAAPRPPEGLLDILDDEDAVSVFIEAVEPLLDRSAGFFPGDLSIIVLVEAFCVGGDAAPGVTLA